jgi:hypothetical protein
MTSLTSVVRTVKAVTTEYLPPRQVRLAVRQARTVYVRTEFGLFKVTKREALATLPRCRNVASVLRVQHFLDSVCVG